MSLSKKIPDIDTTSPDRCSATGLPIHSRPEWTDVSFGKDYRVTVSILGDSILFSKPSGYATRHDVENALKLLDDVVTETIPRDYPYVHIEDFTDLNGVTLDGRKCYIEYIKNRKQVLGLIFCGASSMFKMSIKLGKRLNIVKFNVEIVKDYSEAAGLALKMLSPLKTEIEDSAANVTPQPSVVVSRSNPSPGVITNADWSFQLNGFSARFEVIDGDIFHADTRGFLEEDHLEPLFNMQEMVKKRTIELTKAYTQLKLEMEKRKKAEEALRESEEKYRTLFYDSLEAIGTLAGGVAHDLNNVLSGLVSYPDLLLMDMPDDNPYRKYIITIQKSGEKAAAIVQNLLTLARRGVAVTDVISLDKIVREYMTSPEYEKLILHHPKVQIDYTGPGKDLLNIIGSPVHLSKTVMNLVSNAAEAMPDGGKISIAIENRYIDRPIKGYDNIEESDYVVLEIQDNGKGISSEDLDKIFEPFYKKRRWEEVERDWAWLWYGEQ